MQALVWPRAFQGRGQTLPICKTHAGLHYFVFEGMRFIVSNGKLYRAGLTVGTSYTDFHQASHLTLAMLSDIRCRNTICLCICELDG